VVVLRSAQELHPVINYHMSNLPYIIIPDWELLALAKIIEPQT
jgi:hypothetical protein